MAAAYEPSEVPSSAVTQFVKSLVYLLPCSNCRENWAQLIKEFPVEEWLHSREALFTWTLKARDLVNAHTKKTARKVDYDAVRVRYKIPVQVKPKAKPKPKARTVNRSLAGQKEKPFYEAPATVLGRSTVRRSVSTSRFSRSVVSKPRTRSVSHASVLDRLQKQSLSNIQNVKEGGCKSCGKRRGRR